MRKSRRDERRHGRTREQLWEHYQVERELAQKLKSASRAERVAIYRTMYSELFMRVPHHPRLSGADRGAGDASVRRQMKLLARFLGADTTFAEFGPGAGGALYEVCRRVKRAYGIDISNQLASNGVPKNCEFILYDGYRIGLSHSSVDVAYSHHVVEHLHPEDAEHHFRSVHDLLRPSGKYIIVMPHRMCGPHDISRYFASEAQGFHLKEWSYTELAHVLGKTGYSAWTPYWFGKGFKVRVPGSIYRGAEYVAGLLTARGIVPRHYLKPAFPSLTVVAHK